MRLHNRQIKATFWNDTDLLQWPRDKRWFYEGLIQLADDSGCLEDSPFAFKLNLFPSPVDADITVELLAKWRDELVEEGKLVRYRVGKKDYLYLTNFHKHQSLKNPEKPDVPLPPWIRWEPYESNSRAGKYIVSEDVLTAFLRRSDEVLPIEIEREEEGNRREENITAAANAHAREEESEPQTEPFAAAYRRVFRRDLTPFQAEELGAYIDQEGFEEAVVVRAIERAGRAGGGIRLVMHILNDYAAAGAKTLAGAIAFDAEYEARKQRDGPRKSRQSSQFELLNRLEKEFEAYDTG